MKPIQRILQTILLFGVIQNLSAGEDYGARFRKQMDKRDYRKAGEILDQWGKADAQSLDLLAAEGNFHHVQAHLMDKDEDFDREARLAEKDYESYLERIPNRLDLWLALGDLDLDLGDDEALLKLAEKITQPPPPGGWTWEPGTDPLEGVKTLPDRMEDWGWGLIREETDASDEWARRLALLTAQKFPAHAGAFRVMGRYWIERGNWDKAETVLTAAYDRDDEDSETLLDLGQSLWELEKDKEALACYERVLELNNDPDAVCRARESLQKIQDDGE